MKRTGSIASRVGPAVTTACFPDSGPLEQRPASASRISSGSDMRPSPVSPQAWKPAPGPMTAMPRLRKVARFCWVAALLHISRFIAGATAIGRSLARHSVVSRSLAMPAARRARKSALAGATRMASGQRASSIWPIAASAWGSNRLVRTWRPDSAWKVSAPTNSCAASVIATCTSAPASFSLRTRSAAL